MNQVLLTVSGRIDPNAEQQILDGKRPLADYFALADALQADLADYTTAEKDSGWFGRLLKKFGGPNLLLAWHCFRRRGRYRVIFTDGEQVGIPLALFFLLLGFGSRPRHLMIAHILSVRKKMLLFDLLGLARYIDQFFVYSTWQKQFIESRWKLPGERVVFTPFMVDADFFAPHAVPVRESGEQAKIMICSAGLEFRDYPTLLEAVKGLDIHVVLAAASPWSKRADTTTRQEIPANVTVRRFTQYELRELYAASRFVVMPLYDVNFQAGVTTLLEAMAMEKAVICSRTRGQTDVVVENETGIYVPPGDPQALRAAILDLLHHPEKAERMGKCGRERILREMSLKCYVERLKKHAA
jgi:glycosyltransferase involved in cell wall biosynthesis